jgi:hypothetical protein
MAREALHTADIAIEQMTPIGDTAFYDGDIILADRDFTQEYAAELAFMEEPVTIRLEPSAEKFAAPWFPAWVNGKGAEVHQRGRWEEVGYLPVGEVITIKRKILEVLIRAKHDIINTDVRDKDSERPDNRVTRHTAAVHQLSIIEDRNPRGVPWLSEMRRRNW